jgi:hypothetical protein
MTYLLRDPQPYFQERHGILVEAEELRQELEASGSRAHRLETVHLRSSSGLEVSMLIKRPVSAAMPRGGPEVRRPVILLLGGFRTGKDASRLVEDTRGAVVAAIDYPLYLKKGLRGWRILGAIPAIRRGAMDTPPALMLALDYLLEQPYVDPERVELAGVSLGAPVVCVAGGADPRFRRVWSVHGGGGLWKMLDHNFRGEISSPLLRAPVTALGWLLAANQEPAKWVPKIAPRPFVMINAEEDESIPRAAVDALYEAAREPKELIWMPGEHVQPSRPEVVAGIIDALLGRVAASSGGD